MERQKLLSLIKERTGVQKKIDKLVIKTSKGSASRADTKALISFVKEQKALKREIKTATQRFTKRTTKTLGMIADLQNFDDDPEVRQELEKLRAEEAQLSLERKIASEQRKAAQEAKKAEAEARAQAEAEEDMSEQEAKSDADTKMSDKDEEKESAGDPTEEDA